MLLTAEDKLIQSLPAWPISQKGMVNYLRGAEHRRLDRREKQDYESDSRMLRLIGLIDFGALSLVQKPGEIDHI